MAVSVALLGSMTMASTWASPKPAPSDRAAASAPADRKSGPAPAHWLRPKRHVIAREGTVEERTLRFTAPRRAGKLSVRVSGTLARVLSVDLDRLTAVGRNRYELPVTIAVPAGGHRRYVGTIQLKDRRRLLGRALRVVVITRRADATTIPEAAAAPTRDRIVTTAGGQTVVGDELVVGLSLDAADPERIVRGLAAAHGAQIFGAVPATRTYQLRFPGATLADLEAKRAAIAGVAGVDVVALSVVAETPLATRPNDDEWDSWEDTPAGNNWGLERIKAPKAWDTTTGSNRVRVAVIDNDLDQNHGDLDDNVGRIEGRGPKANGHGTHVAGTICAEGNNGKGISGVAWDCDLRMFAANNIPMTAHEAMVKAVDDGARTVNMSLGFVYPNVRCGSAIAEDTDELLTDANAVLGRALLYAQRARRDVLWVFAAGNECRDARLQSPASLVEQFPTNTITVASVGLSGSLSTFSNRGNLVTVAAPGEVIFSTLPRSCTFGLFCRDRYGDHIDADHPYSGTSMAAPHVTGLATLLFSNKPEMTAAEAKSCIVGGAVKAGGKVAGQPFSVIDAPAALACEGTIDLPPKVDVVLALDLTGSMGGVLELVKTEVAQTIRDLKAASPSTDFRFAVTSYEDYPATLDSGPCGTSTYSSSYGSPPDLPFRSNQALTGDADTVAATVSGLALGNGDDGPESYGRALWEIAQPDTGTSLGFRPDALKLVVNFGDSVPHDPDINEGVEAPPLTGDTGIDPGRNGAIDCGGDDIDFQGDAIADLKSAGIRLLQVDSSGGSSVEPYWRLWTSQTGGAYTRLTRDDGRTLSEIVLELLRLIPTS